MAQRQPGQQAYMGEFDTYHLRSEVSRDLIERANEVDLERRKRDVYLREQAVDSAQGAQVGSARYSARSTTRPWGSWR